MAYRKHRGRTITVDAEVDVDIDQFDDEAVLEGAIEIVERLNSKEASSQDDDSRKLMAKLARLLGVTLDTLPPPSTAATITSLQDLRAWQAKQQQH